MRLSRHLNSEIWPDFYILNHLNIALSSYAQFIFSAEKEKQTQACADSQCGFCGCVALSKPSNCSFAPTSFLKIVFSRGGSSMKLQFSITMICLSFFTAGWSVVTEGNSLSAVLCFCCLRADCFESKMTSDRDLSIYFFEYPHALRRRLKFARQSSNVVF